MDENRTDLRQGCHLDVDDVEPAVVIAAVRVCLINELWWFAAAARAEAGEGPPVRRVPGAQCPVPGCRRSEPGNVDHADGSRAHGGGGDDPPVAVIPAQRVL